MAVAGVLAEHYLGVAASVVKQVVGVADSVVKKVGGVGGVGVCGVGANQSWRHSKCYFPVRWAVGKGRSLKNRNVSDKFFTE